MRQMIAAAATLFLIGCSPHRPLYLVAVCRHSDNIFADTTGRWVTSSMIPIAPGAKLSDVCK